MIARRLADEREAHHSALARRQHGTHFVAPSAPRDVRQRQTVPTTRRVINRLSSKTVESRVAAQRAPDNPTEELVMATPDLLATCWTTAGDAVPPLGASPIPLPTRIAQAARAGFTGFGILHNDLDSYLRAGGSLPALRDLLADNGMRFVELEFLIGWWETDGPIRAEADRVQHLLLEAADVLHAHHVKVGPDLSGGPYEVGAWAKQLRRVSSAFADVGTKTGLEFIVFSNVSTLASAVELLRAVDHPDAGILIDMWQIMRGGAHQLQQVADVPPGLITHVELNDGAVEQVGSAREDALLHRRLPGQGDWPVHELIRILQRNGWDGPWGIEILSETYRMRPLEEALPEVMRCSREQFELARAT
jgi:sugar phosphate isomerase/epimerase